ncbi:hypothetical protein K439DRAFT_1642278 [Ramaria rubella]|nr:hypothetical protein K439DRAFT_1642278 [Ramaria rubella]
MPFAPVGGPGADVQLFYQDSGVPLLHDAQTPYTTLVAVHGLMYNCHLYDRILSLARSSHIRLVTPNRRGYAGSTPFSPEETSFLIPGPDVSDASLTTHYEAFCQKRALELARFLVWFIDTENIPPCSDSAAERGLGRASGGISLMGWSLGNLTTLPLLAFADTFEADLVGKLEGYLRKVVIHDIPYGMQGYRTPLDAYAPLDDPTIPPEERHGRFVVWLQSYFAHAPVASILDPTIPPHELVTRGVLETHITKRVTDFAPADKLLIMEEISLSHPDMCSFMPYAKSVYTKVRQRALYGRNAVKPLLWPRVDVSYIWGTEAPWEVSMAMRTLRDELAELLELVEDSQSKSMARRKVTFFELKGNHFMQYDDPLRLFGVVARALE